mmetsp:Transcript_332/g.493  ORF Transcript_332/g.493 Transcript_332/m.493 type:complete len:116 (+) Transcript_332:683-1030(+)
MGTFVGLLQLGRRTGLPFWNGCQPDLGFDKDKMKRCRGGGLTLVNIQLDTQAAFRHVPFSFVSSKADETQILYYCGRSTFCTQPSFYHAAQNLLKTYNVEQLPATPRSTMLLLFD